MNHFKGALIFPPFGLLVKADATNHHFSCDHMALTESSEDRTKVVIHGVILDKNSKIVQEYVDAHKKVIKQMTSEKKSLTQCDISRRCKEKYQCGCRCLWFKTSEQMFRI